MSQAENLKPSPFSNSRGGFIIHKIVLLVLIAAAYALFSIQLTSIIYPALGMGLLAVACSLVMAGKNIDLGLPVTCFISFVIANLIYTKYSSIITFEYFNEIAIVCGILAAALTGYITGKIITKRNIPAYFGSFAIPSIIFYIIYLLANNNQSINIFLAHNTLPAINNTALYILTGAGLLLSIIFAHSKSGTNLKATGSSRIAAVEAGIDVNCSIEKSYLISGLICGIAGIIINQSTAVAFLTFYNYPVLSWIPFAIIGALLGNSKFSGGRLDVIGSFLGGIFAVFAANVLFTLTNSYEQVLAVFLLFSLIIIMSKNINK